MKSAEVFSNELFEWWCGTHSLPLQYNVGRLSCAHLGYTGDHIRTLAVTHNEALSHDVVAIELILVRQRLGSWAVQQVFHLVGEQQDQPDLLTVIEAARYAAAYDPLERATVERIEQLASS